MAKNYQDYCREAVERDPKTYASRFNPDGSRKPPPNMSSVYKKKVPKSIPRTEERKLRKNGWKPCEEKKPELEVTGTEIRLKGRKLNLTILKMPDKTDRREYNRIWMHNNRVRAKIKKLKEQYGDAIPL